MAVNYTPHRVDIPITDLDDSDDDILFQQVRNESASDNNNKSSRLERGSVDDLDFESYTKPPILQRLKSLFTTSSYNPIESYELRDNLRDFNVSDTEEESGDYEDTFAGFRGSSGTGAIKKHLKSGMLLASLVTIIVLAIQLIKNHNRLEPMFLSSTKAILTNSTHDFHPTTILISLDGFHPHYISPKLTPNLNKLMHSDYGAPYMVPSFPSSTFPNHWTLITGLYPSEHGIVGNTFYDPQLDKQFVNTDPKKGGLDPDFWQGGEPIWQTAFKQGINSAVHMWPGSEVPGVGIDGGGPLEVDRYNGSEVLSSKVKRVMSWLDREDINTRPELILTYVPTIDLYGHKYGISGPELTEALSYVDDFIGLMQAELAHRNLDDIVNLIIVSDHGMAPTSNDRLLYLDDIIDMKKLEHVDGWPLFGLRPFKKYSVDVIFKELEKNFNKLDETTKSNFQLFKLEDIPGEWNFGGEADAHNFNYRLAPIWVIPKVGFAVTTHKQMEESNNDYTPKGVHGYNNTELLMRALFLGTGPYFKSQLPDKDTRMIEPFSNTEIYNLLCQTLNIKPAPNNGTFDNGYVVPVVHQKNRLPSDWTDSLTYPNLGFDVDHIVEDATYDLLWKPKDFKETFKTIYTSATDYEKTMSSKEATMAPNINTNTQTSPNGVPTSPPSKGVDDPDNLMDPGHESSDDEGFLDGLFEELDKIGGEIQEDFQDIGDGLKDGAEDLESGIKGQWNKISGFFHHNDNS